MKFNRKINIINFVRGYNPRNQVDLLGTMKWEVELVKKYDLPATWLLQYDAMIQPEYPAFLKQTLNDKQEIGIWLEIVQPLVEKAGLAWRGRYAWDWHVDPGFSEAYTRAERERLLDVFMADFAGIFGHYPTAMGAWIFDAHTLQYAHERYGIIAACNCKDQWGTDGYTLWGGYWANAYYPCRKNSYLPAQEQNEQIDVPVFRMLGSDPIYQYSVNTTDNGQEVITLEPSYPGQGEAKHGGACPAWVRWFMRNNFSTPNLSMSYAQVGQENPFGRSKIEAGLTDQLGLIRQMSEAGTVIVETLSESGRWFRRNFPVTPASMVTFLEDWRQQGRQAIWFMNRYQRFGFLVENDELLIRDWQLFNQDYAEPYLTTPCRTTGCCYDALPVMDGFRWRGAKMAGIRLNTGVKGKLAKVEECGENSARLTWQTEDGASVELQMLDRELRIDAAGSNFCLQFIYSCEAMTDTSIELQDEKQICCVHKGFRYSLKCLQGHFRPDDGIITIVPQNGRVIIQC